MNRLLGSSAKSVRCPADAALDTRDAQGRAGEELGADREALADGVEVAVGAADGHGAASIRGMNLNQDRSD